MRGKIYDNFFLLILIFGFYGILKLLAPFSGALLGALICAVTFYPMYAALRRRFPRRGRAFHAATADILVLLFFITPLLLLMWMFYAESSSLIEAIRRGTAALAQLRSGRLIDHGLIHRAETNFLRPFGMSHQAFRNYLFDEFNGWLMQITNFGRQILAGSVYFCLDLVVMIFALFFMFRDGEKLSRYFMDLIPLRRSNKDALSVRIHETVIAVIRGWLLTSVVQGLAAMLGYWLIQAHAVVLLGTLTAALGLLPAVGTLAVSVPIALYYFSIREYARACFILFWGFVIVVGLIDTLLRPYLIGKRTDLSLFALFFALLGGVEIWGVKGIILGPLLVAVMPLLLDIYRERYLRQRDRQTVSSSSKEMASPILD